VSGQSYYDYVRDHITKPAGMTDTASYAIDDNVPNRAIGHTRRGPEGPLPERHSNAGTLPARGSSAGGGYSTAADLLKFSIVIIATVPMLIVYPFVAKHFSKGIMVGAVKG
jgi:CubicO group peptidase (beta-lactamase class C family)